MGKENICFWAVWIILGNISVTFSSEPEPTAGTVFGKTDPSVCVYLEITCLAGQESYESPLRLYKVNTQVN